MHTAKQSKHPVEELSDGRYRIVLQCAGRPFQFFGDSEIAVTRNAALVMNAYRQREQSDLVAA